MKFRETTDTSWAAVFDAQVKTNSRFFFQLASRILRDGGAAEDACQQAFLKAWEQRELLRTPSAIKAWLTKAVVNASLQAHRRRQIEQRVMQNHQRHQSNTAAYSPAPVDQRESILLAVETLPELQRTVVVLRIMQGMSGNETMEVVGCSSSEVSKQLHRGLERLRLILADWEFDQKG